MNAQTKETPKIETVPDAWERFESAVDKALKTPPVHRTEAKTDTTRPPMKRERSSHAR